MDVHRNVGLSDEALLAGLAAGDDASAATFVRRDQGRVYGLALTIVGDAAAAEDIAQEAFTRAWRHAAAYDPRRATAATWILAITRNLAIDALRMRRAHPADPDTIAAQLVPVPSPDEQDFPPDESMRLRHALAELPEDQRRALVLAAFGGQSAREIGEREGIPLRTAKTRIRAAMIKLRSAMTTAEQR